MKKLACVFISLIFAVEGQSGTMIWAENFNDNSYSDQLNIEKATITNPGCNTSSSYIFKTVTNQKREGSRGALVTLDRCNNRAEFVEKSVNQPSVGENRWYGFSIKLANNFDDQAINESGEEVTIVMQLAQWYSGLPSWAKGSWHTLKVKDGRWRFKMKYSSGGNAGASGVREVEWDLGPAVKNQWTDFVINGKWVRSNSGQLRIWVRQPGNNDYIQKVARYGWVMLNVPKAPYFKIGLYRGVPWTGANYKDRVFIDAIKVAKNASIAEVSP
ncbi:MAG: heparin lyase I family protein [Verrucomicrobiota bacterium]